MSIGNIVCRSGVGPTATIPLFVTHGLDIGAPAPILVDYDTGQKTRKANKARDKALKEERERAKRRRDEVIDAFERAFEGKVDLPEVAIQEMVNTIEARQENNPSGPDFGAILANLSNIEALWRDYLEKDDEEVLALL